MGRIPMNETRRGAYTAREVSKIISVDLYTVHELLRRGRLAGFRIRTHWRITPEALEKFMKGEVKEDVTGDQKADV